MLAALRVCWKVAAKGRVSWLVVCALLAVVERLAALASAFAWGSTTFVPLVVAFGVVTLAHRALRARMRTIITATAFTCVVERAMDDAPHVGERPPMSIVEAAHHAARAVIDLMVPLTADVLASIVALVLLIRVVAPSLLIVGVLVVAVGVVAAQMLPRSSESAYQHYLSVLDALVDTFDGRSELLASGASVEFTHDARVTIERWRAKSFASELRSAVASQLPLFAAALVILSSPHLERVLVQNIVVLAAVSPACFGVVRSIQELSKITVRIEPLEPLIKSATSHRGVVAPDAARLDWNDVTLDYGGHVVLSDVTVGTRRGETLALAGPNGAGKTTLLLAALGLRDPLAGEVRIGDVDLRRLNLNAWRRSVHYLPQRPYLLPRRSVRAAMRFPPCETTDDAMTAALHRVRLHERLATFSGDPLDIVTDTLSAGERQRLALARMLCRDADVYLLDEPDANLDADGVRDVAELIRELARSGKIVVVAAHTPEVIAVADRVVHLEAGRVTSIEDKSHAQTG